LIGFISGRTIVAPIPGWLFPKIEAFSMDHHPGMVSYVSTRYRYTSISRVILKERKKLLQWFVRTT
jgi:hypothetical protein